MTITHQTVLDRDGNPTAAIIPWQDFLEFAEARGLDLSDEEVGLLREALDDSAQQKDGAFVPADEV